MVIQFKLFSILPTLWRTESSAVGEQRTSLIIGYDWRNSPPFLIALLSGGGLHQHRCACLSIILAHSLDTVATAH